MIKVVMLALYVVGFQTAVFLLLGIMFTSKWFVKRMFEYSRDIVTEVIVEEMQDQEQES